MLIKKVNKYMDTIPKGVIHIGGHAGEEQVFYDKIGVKNVVWIEAIPESAEGIMYKFKDRNDIKVLCECISDKTELCEFNITNNRASSSLLKFGTHKKEHPKVKMVRTVTVIPVTLSELIEQGIIDISKYDMLNIDVQGTELDVLKSLGKYIENIKYIYSEVNVKELYKGCCKLSEIDKYLTNYNRIVTRMTQHGWGDALYISK